MDKNLLIDIEIWKIELNKEEILDNLKPVEMSVFSYRGDIDTTMSPDDSILYYKGYLHAGLISIEPQMVLLRLRLVVLTLIILTMTMFV